VRARAHACVALGRCVAFGRPKISVWGHAGARSAPAKVACISFTTSLFWYLFDVSVSSFLFQTPLHQNSLETLNGHSQLRTRWRFRALTVTLTLARGRTPTRTHHAHPCYRESRTGHDPRRCYARRYELPGLPVAPTRRLKHTCTKARSENKRHTSPSVDSRHAKRSGTGSAPALTATEAVQIPGASLAIDFGSDVGVRAGEMHVLSEAPSHISSSSLAPIPSHMPVPTPTLEQGEATEVDGDVVMAEGDAFARDTRIHANQAVDGLAPRACQHEVVPPPSPARVPSAEENDHLFLPPEGSFVCVTLQDGVLPPELHVFTNIGTCNRRDPR
jgi:hypothetical protein